MKIKRFSASILSLFLLFILFASSYSFHIKGTPGLTNKAATSKGCYCHGDAKNDSVRVVVTGPSIVRSNEKAQYEIRVIKKRGKGAGFGIASRRGKIDPIDTTTKKVEPELVHSKVATPDQYEICSWKFLYTPPEKENVLDTIFSVGLSSNGDRKEGGDAWNFGAPYAVKVVAVGIPSTVYNPEDIFEVSLFQRELSAPPVLDIELNVEDVVKVEILTLGGKPVTTIKEERLSKGEHIVPIPADGLSAGQYYARVTVRGAQDKLKFTITK
jgi:hypothetical protein